MEKPWYMMAKQEVLERQHVSVEKGLNETEAKRRLDIVGRNELVEKKKISPIVMFFSQFKDFMVLVLIAATIISALLGEFADAITILAIIIVNAFLGFLQEYKAEKSMEALKQLIAPEATVIRNGITKKVHAAELVPGDIVLLETGDIIPADLRLYDTSQMEIEESALTGESVPVKKNAEIMYSQQMGLGDRKNLAFMGTIITRGKGIGIVTDTGMQTEMGQIAGLIQQVEEEDTPLQKRLEKLGKWLVAFCLAIVTVVVFTGIFRGENIYRMFLTGVSLAVAAIPEGLPAIVTIALAIGVQKMIKRRAIVRKLPAVETLGCATVICSDKTGTLTQNEMTVRQVFASGGFVSVTGEGYAPKGDFNYPMEKDWYKQNQGCFDLIYKVSSLCNNAILQKEGTVVTGLFRDNKNQWKILGDPTEGALLVLASKAGIWRENIERKNKRIYEIPFDSDRKRMSVICEASKGLQVYTKGAPDIILNLCNKIWWNGKIVNLTKEIEKQIIEANEKMGKSALRVLGLAYKDISALSNFEDENNVENDLVFLGLTGMIDPPRPSAIKAVSVCRSAGIKTVMITGDHKITAEAVAKELKVLRDGDSVLTGRELDEMNDKELANVVNQVVVYARVSPKHKLRIVKALKQKGQIVAMTGDGVNDAPAVKEADIGIAMGITGTDVTKEASAMILGDDDFATIVSAVEEGRAIYDNIRKFIRYLLSCNVGEVLTMFVSALMGLPLPLLPIQILWVNLVTDGLPAMALGVDTSDPDIMYRRPRSPKESIFAHGLSRRILVRGSLICFSTLTVFIIGFYMGGKDLFLARTMAFTTLVFSQLFHVFDCRSERYSIFEIGVFTNPYLVAAVSCSVIMHLCVIYLPFLQHIFKTTSLSSMHWLIILSLSGGITILQGIYRNFKVKLINRLKYARV